MTVELRHLRSFVAVAEEQHFGRAAARLQVAQPPLSQQIRRLEDELGVELIDRSSRPIGLTAAGAAFLEEAERTLDQAKVAVERSRRVGRAELGHLSIGALPWAYNGILPGVVRAFQARAPEVELELFTRTPREQTDALCKQRLDVGFVGFSQRLTDTRALLAEPLVEEPMVAIVADDHPLGERSQVSLAELAAEPFVSMSRAVAPELVDQQTALFRERGLRPNVVQEAPDVQALLGLVAAGVGVSLHMASFANLRRRGVAFVPLEDDSPTTTLLLAWRRDDERHLVQALVETARAVARSDGRVAGY